MTYDPSLADSISRVRFAVGDTADTALLADETYTAALRLTRRRVQVVTLASAGLITWLDLPNDGSAVVFSHFTADPGLDADTLYYVRDGDTTDLTSNVASTPTGDAITLSDDADALAGVADESAAIREIARGLAIKFAQEPDNVGLPNGLRVAWSNRISAWQAIAKGDAGGGRARTAQGMRWKKGAAIDYSTGDGDATL
jgi:hypothetical protein